jgi:hypothetical protein
MTLQNIETAILQLVGYDVYSSLSVDSSKTEEFSLLHRCVNIARDEIRLNTIIQALLKHTTTISSVDGTKRYTISNTDFDIPIVARYKTSSDEIKLIRTDALNVLDDIGSTTDEGTPSHYQIFGSTSAGLSYVELFPVPDTSGETLDMDYKPVLTDLISASDEDIILKKYPMTVIKIATAWAFQFLKKDDKNFDKWTVLGFADFPKINLRETGFDKDPTVKIDSLVAQRRKDRYTL